MKTCLNFTIRSIERPLHLCYVSGDEATKALREFARDIDSIPDGETVFIEGGRPDGRERCVGFLKRDFLSIERDAFDDEDGGGDESEPPVEEKSNLPFQAHAAAGHVVAAATKIVTAAAAEDD